MEMPFIRSPYNYDRDKVSDETGLLCEDESKTQQHQKEEADINTIIRRFGLSGELPTNVRVPQYGDFQDIGTYQEALNAVMKANETFMRYPAHIRNRFNNNPAEFVDFCSDPNNAEELVKLGLAVKIEPAAKEQVPPATEPGANVVPPAQ